MDDQTNERLSSLRQWEAATDPFIAIAAYVSSVVLVWQTFQHINAIAAVIVSIICWFLIKVDAGIVLILSLCINVFLFHILGIWAPVLAFCFCAGPNVERLIILLRKKRSS